MNTGAEKEARMSNSHLIVCTVVFCKSYSYFLQTQTYSNYVRTWKTSREDSFKIFHFQIWSWNKKKMAFFISSPPPRFLSFLNSAMLFGLILICGWDIFLLLISWERIQELKRKQECLLVTWLFAQLCYFSCKLKLTAITSELGRRRETIHSKYFIFRSGQETNKKIAFFISSPPPWFLSYLNSAITFICFCRWDIFLSDILRACLKSFQAKTTGD